ncbi:MAG: hypothetical protein FJX75_29590 [Armatimonadetes bacterium]|nr:hypothetical protein [Armatimonadota bacterium]
MSDSTLPDRERVKYVILTQLANSMKAMDELAAKEGAPPAPRRRPHVDPLGEKFPKQHLGWTGDAAQVEELIRDVCVELQADGIVVCGSGLGENTSRFYATPQGRVAISEGRFESVEWIGPDRYVQSVEGAAGASLDPVVRTYLTEAKRASDGGLELSCAVSLGCASERAILQLAEVVVETVGDKGLENALGQPLVGIASVFRRLDVRLRAYRNDNGLQRHDHWRELDALGQLFHLYRTHRNTAGHPTGETPDRAALLCFLRGFSVYMRMIGGLTEYLTKAHQ